MKSLIAQNRFIGRMVAVALLMIALFAAPRGLFAQHSEAGPVRSAATAHNKSSEETPRSEEEQEQGFLNAPIVAKLGHAFNLSEPVARDLFLAINFAIIFLAIVIPLGRMMPKIFRKRSQTLRHSLDLARQATEEARERLNAVEAKLAGLDKDIGTFRAQVEQESLEDEKRIKASLKEESERIVASAEQEISAAATHARRNLRQFAADLAIEHATRQLTLTPETDRALIEEFIGQVASQNGQAAAAPRGGKQ